jgi:hypothetical protein
LYGCGPKLAAYIQSQDNWQHLLRFTEDMSGAIVTRPGLMTRTPYTNDGRRGLCKFGLPELRAITTGTAKECDLSGV